MVRAADLVLIPTRPSPHDLRAVGSTVALVEEPGEALCIRGDPSQAERPADRSGRSPRFQRMGRWPLPSCMTGWTYADFHDRRADRHRERTEKGKKRGRDGRAVGISCLHEQTESTKVRKHERKAQYG